MSDVNLAMAKTIEIILSVLVIISSLAAIYTYDAQSNYLLSFSSAKLKLIYDSILMYHDKGLSISFNEYYPFSTRFYDDKIELILDDKKIITQLETIEALNGQTTKFKDEIKLTQNKLESYAILFQNSQLVPLNSDYESVPMPNEEQMAYYIEDCNFEQIPKMYLAEINIDNNNMMCD